MYMFNLFSPLKSDITLLLAPAQDIYAIRHGGQNETGFVIKCYQLLSEMNAFPREMCLYSRLCCPTGRRDKTIIVINESINVRLCCIRLRDMYNESFCVRALSDRGKHPLLRHKYRSK